MVMTVSLESTAVVSASGASVKDVVTRPELKNVTTIENKMVFAMKKNFRTE
jgi:hypothetical protein